MRLRSRLGRNRYRERPARPDDASSPAPRGTSSTWPRFSPSASEVVGRPLGSGDGVVEITASEHEARDALLLPCSIDQRREIAEADGAIATTQPTQTTSPLAAGRPGDKSLEERPYPFAIDPPIQSKRRGAPMQASRANSSADGSTIASNSESASPSACSRADGSSTPSGYRRGAVESACGRRTSRSRGGKDAVSRPAARIWMPRMKRRFSSSEGCRRRRRGRAARGADPPRRSVRWPSRWPFRQRASLGGPAGGLRSDRHRRPAGVACVASPISHSPCEAPSTIGPDMSGVTASRSSARGAVAACPQLRCRSSLRPGRQLWLELRVIYRRGERLVPPRKAPWTCGRRCRVCPQRPPRQQQTTTKCHRCRRSDLSRYSSCTAAPSLDGRGRRSSASAPHAGMQHFLNFLPLPQGQGSLRRRPARVLRRLQLLIELVLQRRHRRRATR